MLNAPVIVGMVSKGQQLGRTLGFPTTNILINKIDVAHGVYVVSVRLADGRMFDGVANLGRRPTIGMTAPLLETHLFEFDEDLYGQEIEVTLRSALRAEQHFNSLDDLKRQIECDCIAARAYVSSVGLGR